MKISCLEAHHRFAGKVAVVTGGASGIGEATVRLFVEHGAFVVIADVNKEGGVRLAEELGEQAQFVSCDVRCEDEVAAVVDEAVRWKGKLDVYHSNAGFVGALGSIEELNLAEFDETLAVNLRGAVVGIKHATRVMKPAGRGAIVCTGSTASVMGGLGPHSYSVSKTALTGLVRSTALELRGYGISVNMVSPDAHVPARAAGLHGRALHSGADPGAHGAEGAPAQPPPLHPGRRPRRALPLQRPRRLHQRPQPSPRRCQDRGPACAPRLPSLVCRLLPHPQVTPPPEK
jgi:NAD(P)-dependent dehydrogenase (short-subunit alcohol dehydrogenase family)